MKYARRTDANHAHIRDGLRAMGCFVWDTHALGGGFPDLLALRPHSKTWILLEVKDGTAIPSRRKLTPQEKAFFAACPGPIAVVESLDEAVEAVLGKRSP